MLVFKLILSCCGLLLIASLVGCSDSRNASSVSTRGGSLAELDSEGKPRDISLGVVWPGKESPYVNGIRLAVDEVNSLVKLGEPKYSLTIIDELSKLGGVRTASGIKNPSYGSNRNVSQLIAKEITDELIAHENLVAVFGHSNLFGTTLAAAINYQDAGVLFFSADSRDPLLTHLQAPLVFQVSPSDEILSLQLAQFLNESKDVERVLILHSRGRESFSFVNNLQEASDRSSNLTIFRQVIPGGETVHWGNHAQSELVVGLAKMLVDQSIDIILIVSDQAVSQRIIRDVRGLGFEVPFLVMPQTSSTSFVKTLGDQAIGITMPVLVDESSAKFYRFSQKYYAKYKKQPESSYAVLGYDSIYILDNSIRNQRSDSPLTISLALRYLVRPWKGVAGNYAFTTDGMNTSRYRFQSVVADVYGKPSVVTYRHTFGMQLKLSDYISRLRIVHSGGVN